MSTLPLGCWFRWMRRTLPCHLFIQSFSPLCDYSISFLFLSLMTTFHCYEPYSFFHNLFTPSAVMRRKCLSLSEWASCLNLFIPLRTMTTYQLMLQDEINIFIDFAKVVCHNISIALLLINCWNNCITSRLIIRISIQITNYYFITLSITSPNALHGITTLMVKLPFPVAVWNTIVIYC